MIAGTGESDEGTEGAEAGRAGRISELLICLTRPER